MKNAVCLVALAFTLGCTTAVVRPYIGEQPAWPTAGGSVINTEYALPIFTTLPSAPYAVIGELRIESPFYATPEPGQLPVLIKKTKQLGGDALLLVNGSSFFTASSSAVKPSGTGARVAPAPVTVANTFLPDAFKGGASIVAIRWTDAPPQGLPAKYAKKAATTKTAAVVPAPPPAAPEPVKPKEQVVEPKPQPKTNFGPMRPAAEETIDKTATTTVPSAVPAAAADPRKVPTP